MQTYVALLYSIVLGEGRRVVMSDLRAMTEGLGSEQPAHVGGDRQSGFRDEETEIAALERRLETAFQKTFGRHVDIIVRRADDWLKLCGRQSVSRRIRLPPRIR